MLNINDHCHFIILNFNILYVTFCIKSITLQFLYKLQNLYKEKNTIGNLEIKKKTSPN